MPEYTNTPDDIPWAKSHLLFYNLTVYLYYIINAYLILLY